MKLEKAPENAEPLAFFRFFVDEGPKMGSLLYEASLREISHRYVSRLLRAGRFILLTRQIVPQPPAAGQH